MTPALAIFAFTRPESLRRLFDSLAACPEYKSAYVTVFIDGPRSSAEEVLVSETYRVAEGEAAGSSNWNIVRATQNKGLRRSIHDGVSDICSRFGHAIVLEDDLVVAPAAISYFVSGLERYRDEPRVWSICGYTYEHRTLARENRHVAIPFCHPWGWATWHRAWKQFEFDQPIIPAEQLSSSSFKRFFDVDGLSLATDLLWLAQRGMVDSWFIRWHLKIFSRGGVSLFPTRRYVVNAGVGRGGTHASILNPYKILLNTEVPTNDEVGVWPEELMVDFSALTLMRNSRDARVQRALAKLGMMKRILKRQFKRPKSK